MYCLTHSFSFIWSRGKSSFLGFQNGSSWFVVRVTLTDVCLVSCCIIQFEVFGIEVGSCAFPTPFGREIGFATCGAF